MTIDWQSIAMAALVALSVTIWFEIRQLRKSKHTHANEIQYILICTELLARHVGCPLPKRERDD